MRIKANTADFKQSFLSFEKDQELIWKRMFVENRQYGDMIKRLLVINASDCLDMQNVQYRDIISRTSIADLRRKKYIRCVPSLDFGEFEEVKSYILLSFDDVTATSNTEYNNYVISFTVVCHLDYWEMDDYKIRPWQIGGYIHGIMNKAKLTGIGELQFLSASEVVLNEHLSGIMLRYVSTNNIEADKNPNMLEG